MLGRVIQITQTAKDASSMPRTQTRTYTYDNRGFLKTEKHPEKGASGNGTVTYSNYDPRGLPGRVQDGPNDLTFTYDTAGRLTQVKETGTGGRVIKSYTYATANGTSNWRNGKVEVARRYNYVLIGTTPYTVEIAETYTYGGRGGRPSKRDTQAYVNGGAFESFTQSWAWNDLGDTGSVTYPKCTHTGCTATTARTVSPTYTNGFLTAVPGYASPITYQANGMIDQITHLNTPGSSATWVTDTNHPDADNLPRPSKIESKLGANVTWSSGTYAYDGSGNLVKTGSAYMLYDKVSRASSGLLYTGAGAGGSTTAFSNTYDGFGNLTGITSGTTRTIAVEWATNRVDTITGSTQYDSAGNMTRWNSGPTYEYDRLDMMWHMKNGAEDWLYLYTADDERIWSYKPAANSSRWTLRDLDRKVLREYDNLGGAWTVRRDYVYRGRSLVAAHTSDPSPKDLIQFHLDHLGTPRAITDKNGTRIAYHLYYPYGEEATGFNQDQERAKFTGHERDLASLGGAGDDLDNMHARIYNGQLGKFLGVDPLRGRPSMPQTLNRYSYVMGNPLKYVDPFGLEPVFPGGGETITVTGTPYRFDTGYSGASQLYYDSFFLQNVSFLISPQAPPPPAPMPAPQPPVWVNPTGNCPRGRDGQGSGQFQASRGTNRGPHEGTDYLATAGQDVVAPTAGTITRPVHRVYKTPPYHSGFLLTGFNGYEIKGFYVTLDPSLVGSQVAAGDVLGPSQDLTPRYPGISNHVHIEILDANGNLIDPTTLIPTPGCP
jgi:RHS repeat-associated protein